MMQKWPNYQSWMNCDDVPLRFVGLDKFPSLALGKGLARGVYEMSVIVADTLFPRSGVVIIFLTSISS